MKKLFLLIILLALKFAPAKAQYVTIPDPYFATKLTQLFPSCMNGSQLDTTCFQIINCTTLNVNNLYITDLSGVEYFDNLITLNCNNNQLTSLPALPSTLVYLNCNTNNLTSLPTLPDSLKELRCSFNDTITSLPTLPSSLQYLACSNNRITSLPSLPGSLKTLYCGSQLNQLTSLPALPNSLTYLDCSSNYYLTTLPTLPTSLQNLNCGYCTLTSLPTLPGSLITLSCYNNHLTSLPLLPNSLLKLYCGDNQLTNISTLPNTLSEFQCKNNLLTILPPLPNSLELLDCGNNPLTSPLILPDSLQSLSCSGNQLTSLPALPDSLHYLYCGSNQLSNLPSLPSALVTLDCPFCQLTSLPQLPNSLTSLNCSYNQLTSIPPVPDVMEMFNISDNNILCLSFLPNYSLFSFLLDISNNPLTCVPNQTDYSLGLPLCMDNDPVNNPNYCPAVANITGYVYGDLNSNCNYDSTDFNTDNIPVKIFDSQNNFLALSYTVNGMYSFTLLQPDTFHVKVEDNLLPISMDCGQANNQSVLLDSANQTLSGINFPVVCDTINDIKIQSVIPHGLVFPGQVHTINTDIVFNQNWYNLNCFSASYSGTVTVEVTGPVTYTAPATNGLIPIVTGNTFTYNISNFSNINPHSFGLQFTTDTTAQLGNQVCVHVEILPTPLDADTTNNVYDFCYNVINSYDPNLKEVYPMNVLPGYDDWFTYTIHFQNTGNAPAINIRLRDTLDTQLDLNTFEVLGYSNTPTISINGHILTVRFNNIMLPDSTSDYEGSMGYFQYRIKPLPNLPLGSQISNTAYIYFDYNAPVVTNTTQNNFTTVVNTSTALPQASLPIAIGMWLFPNPSSGIFTFNDNKNIKTVEVFNMMGELILSQGNAKEINLNSFPKGIYVARINGEYVCRLVKE